MIDDDVSTGPERPTPEPRQAADAGFDAASAPRARQARRSRHATRGPRAPRPSRSPRSPRAPRSGLHPWQRLSIAVGALAIVVFAIVFGVWSTLFRPLANVPAGRHVTLTIAKGSSGDEVATMLARAGVVTNPTMFRLRASLLGAAGDILPGTYAFTTGSDYDGVVRQLQQGPLITYATLTIPEGWGIEATAARVQRLCGIPSATFIKLASTGAARFHYAFLADNPTKSLEGYLFPKTYQVRQSSTATDVINMMLAQYGKETAALDYSYATSKHLTPHEVLTIASIIEREAVLDRDRPKVASVIYNRLGIGMRLQLDSTVQYALHGKAKLTLSDLTNSSPYNTYAHTGLPPGPICSPGLVSIRAALAPSKTSYLFYILTGKDGSQSFTSSYAKFLQFKAQTEKFGLR
jgi:UPF0755 protein